MFEFLVHVIDYFDWCFRDGAPAEGGLVSAFVEAVQVWETWHPERACGRSWRHQDVVL